ncbi:MAG TPA: site-specific DNA-methyltransferase [Blastocatellia bacterium]|nr:site-specific DNA-methyltransferase [Blastocatellia bacterium]HMX27120.1 site-specific DNA-methyltransferase [Blastocatellia bacterium]HMY73066.1 site-specific DNA-methyltransferase [Blastocatellia bacterium]HMZ19571.1 site-specific DNA-methyltransferase [Blastocatellia bacterium]HNG32888.1 site-specific DNA-methyltransferase [Blastocatellia bacterium]
MARKSSLVAEQRKYSIIDVKAAKQVCDVWLQRADLRNAVSYGLPEVDDRYHFWRVPLLNKVGKQAIGEIVIDAYTSLILENKSTAPEVLEARLLGRDGHTNGQTASRSHSQAGNGHYPLSTLRNTIALGDSEEVLQDLPAGSVDLIFTSPPYYNARPEYTDYLTYEEYLLKIRKVMQQAHRVLAEGRFFVMNVSPVLIRRANRSESSKRIAVPFDMHRLFVEEGYDFIDDIIWEKPEGAGWAVGRGRRFAADRNPLQYKAVSVTEYVLVYRKSTSKLIDWNIRAHPKQELVKASRIGDDYERTNIWRIKPAHDPRHPAIFPVELAKKVISYYSFKDDVVLDPFAGIGTTGKAAAILDRRFVLIEQNPEYVSVIRHEAEDWLGEEARQVLTINCPAIEAADRLF